MTSALAIVGSVDEAALATQTGFARVAIQASLPRAGGANHSVLSGERSAGFLMLDVAGSGIEPGEVARRALAARTDRIWLPLDANDHRFAEASVRAGLAAIGILGSGQTIDAAVCRDAVALGLVGLLLIEQTPEGRLIDTVGIAALGAIVALCREHQLTIALAGGLEAGDVPRLLAIRPDELGFEGALRDSAGRFDPVAAQSILDLMRTEAAVPQRPGPRQDVRDRIFVRDWTIAIGIGVYARERGVAQRVRFSVEAEIVPGSGSGLASVVSYDLITDAIARLTAGHVDLVEELAERLAARVLAHPRVEKVDITIEKLDVGPGSLGCRIVRQRS